jgi:Core-2/I-Branching enzyme
MFVLLSESCIPLYHPALFWTQLLAEAHVSRVSDGVYSEHRWNDRMRTARLNSGNFRKSSQWSSLTRAHAQIVATDLHVWPMFRTYCRALVRSWASAWSSKLNWVPGRPAIAIVLAHV